MNRNAVHGARRALIAVGMSGVLLLAACGDDDEEPAPATPAEGSMMEDETEGSMMETEDSMMEEQMTETTPSP